MAKNKLGKFITFATGIAAIGGVCYIFRDKIKESEVYKKVTGTIADWLDKDEDFDHFDFDDEDDMDDAALFSDSTKKNREYTSITINSPTESEEEESMENEPVENESVENEPVENESVENESAESTPAVSEDDIVVNPTITKDSLNTTDEVSSPLDDLPTEETKADAYENEGLSDVSEDPDVLEEQDKLDF